MANEGRFVVFVGPEDAERTVSLLREHAVARRSAVVGTVHDGPAGEVTCRGALGAARVVDMLSGEQLPRIC